MLIYIITIILHHNIQFMMIFKKHYFHYSFLPLQLLSSPVDSFMSFHFINLCDSLKRMKSGKKVSVAQLCLTLCDPMDCSPPGSSVHGDSLGKNTRVGCHALLQGIFTIQGLNPGLPHCRQILYHLTRDAQEYWSG